MTKDQFKMLVKEALIEVLPDVIRIVNESSNSPSIQETQLEGLSRPSSIDSYIQETLSERSNNRTSQYNLDNPRQVINGTPYASGKGVLEWFANKKKPDVIEHREFKHRDDDVNSYLSKTLGVNIK